MNAATLVSRLSTEARRSRSIMISGGILLAIAIIAIIGPLLSPHSYLTTNFDGIFVEPTFDKLNLFGTDDLGRDVWSRVLYGGQISLMVGAIAMVHAKNGFNVMNGGMEFQILMLVTGLYLAAKGNDA